ncbi:MAG: type II secretion system F family protein [Armatimonadetes bacterium]|nr:type II secretion system F family protein [Armatimonadota bacterium]MDW8026965.1 type II secretion system F family protein [Armatimonadota bacterium]
MPVYEYEARDKTGQLKRGTIVASDQSDATRRLRDQELIAVRLSEQKPPSAFAPFRVPARPLAIFFRHLYNTYRSGIPLSESLDLFARTERSPLKFVATHAAKRASEGIPLSQAFRESGYDFPLFVLPLIEAGERSGRLEQIFGHLAQHFEREAEFEQEFKRGTIFAKAYMGCSILAMLMVLGIASSISSNLPIISILKNGLKVLAALIGLWILWRILAMTKGTAKYTDLILMHLPFVSIPFRKLMAARFARTMALLYASGLPPDESLELAAQSTGNFFIIDSAEKLKLQLQKGEKFSSVIGQMPFMPPLIVQMLATGEKSGNLDESMTKAAEFLESEAQTGLKSLPIVAGFALYGFVILMLVFLILQMAGAIAAFYQGIVSQ